LTSGGWTTTKTDHTAHWEIRPRWSLQKIHPWRAGHDYLGFLTFQLAQGWGKVKQNYDKNVAEEISLRFRKETRLDLLIEQVDQPLIFSTAYPSRSNHWLRECTNETGKGRGKSLLVYGLLVIENEWHWNFLNFGPIDGEKIRNLRPGGLKWFECFCQCSEIDWHC
jgi:hypothetical protein